MFVLLIVGLAMGRPLVALALPAVYFSALIAIGLSFIPRHGLAVSGVVPLALFILHFAYGMGMIVGFLAAVFHPRAWETDRSMSSLTR
jgi:hypothetical protein